MPGTAISAAIFDLDGVVVETATVHARAWKQVFDAFLKDRADRLGVDFVPFDPDGDYRRYVDGMPRLDGIRSFLASRDIDLPEGEASDPPDAMTVHGLGTRKNALFRQTLREHGVTAYTSTVALIDRLRENGFRTALISASRNCTTVLEAAGLQDLFDAQVDGVESGRLGLAGKPAPDIFLEAARRLGVEPAEAAVIEDAIAGVEAARRGGFGLVIGIERGRHGPQPLRDHGAEVVVRDLSELDPATFRHGDPEDLRIPSALARFGHIAACLNGRRPAVFLDYDGTLTPIVARPDLAVLDEAMRARMERLAALCPVAVISGRDLANIRSMVGIDSIHFAGSHGFEYRAPDGETRSLEEAAAIPDIVASAAADLHGQLDDVAGVLIEPKRFAVAVHYRQADPADLPDVERAVDEVLTRHPDLKKGLGKKVFELRPALPWDKGRAIAWVIEAIGLREDAVVPIYIGDDHTDEDAFEMIRGNGIGIVVLDESRSSGAHYRLQDTDETGAFLENLARELAT